MGGDLHTPLQVAEVVDDSEIDSGPEARTWRLDAEFHSMRVDKALATLVPEFSRSYLQSLVSAGEVKLDGRALDLPSRKVRAGQLLEIRLVPPAEARAFVPQEMPLDVEFQDEHLLVIDKPAGLVVHPAAGNWSGTLLNGLLAYDDRAAMLPRAGIVHRLDKDTSGLMVVARTLEAMTMLSRDLAARDIRRRYRALAHGDVGLARFSVEAPIGRDPSMRVRMAVNPQGKPARTDVIPVATRQIEAAPVSAVRCELHTGRTHQIRVHMAHMGHPLVADTLYGGRPLLGMLRQALHAAELELQHPITRQWLKFTSEPPADFASAWAAVVQD